MAQGAAAGAASPDRLYCNGRIDEPCLGLPKQTVYRRSGSSIAVALKLAAAGPMS